MADAFLSPAWYRVAALRPALASHVRVHRHRYAGAGWYVLEDRISGKSHRLNAAAYAFVGRFDGMRTVDEIWLEVAALLDEAAPTQDDAITLLGQLHNADLLRPGTAPDVQEVDERRRKAAGALLKQNLLNPMSLRLPLFDPDRLLTLMMPFARPFIGAGGFVLWLALMAVALALAGRHWEALSANISDRVLARDNLLLLACVYPVVKALHEFGHGLVAKRYGAAVHETGVMFLIFFPVPYVDASGAAAFQSRWQRAAVGSAGMLVETTLAAIALFVWLVLEPGLARAVCFNVMLIGGVSTVLVNGNPLIRFDGYYILSDILRIPNLGARANKYVGRLVETGIFGLDDPRPFQANLGEKVAFVLYAPASYLYRIALLASISLFVAQRYLAAGVLLAVWMVGQSVVVPIGKLLWHVLAAPRLRRRRRRAVAITALTIAGVAAGLFAVPVPAWSTAEGVVWLPQAATLRAGTSGFLVGFDARPDEQVAPGAQVARLDDPVIDARLASLAWKARELELKLAANTVTDKVLAQTTRIEFDDAMLQYTRERDRKGRLTLLSEAAGRFVPAGPPDDLAGRFFKEGDVIGYVLPARAEVVRVVVLQAEIDLVAADLRGVRIAPAWRRGDAVAGRLLRAVPAGLFELPSPALSQAAGGPIVTDPRDSKNQTALARVFQFDVEMPSEPAPFGARVHVKFEHAPMPLGQQLYRRARQLLLSNFDV